jgi:siroheme decarboxylase
MNGAAMPDETDLALLDALQDDLPLVPRPWEAIAGRLNIPESELLLRLERLHLAGIVRGVSPILESRPMGLNASTLVAMHVPMDRLNEVAAIISSYPEVSHNFQRDHHYSLWFTLSARDEEGIRHVLNEILHETGIPPRDVLDLPTVKKIKIDVRFSFTFARKQENARGSP